MGTLHYNTFKLLTPLHLPSPSITPCLFSLIFFNLSSLFYFCHLFSPLILDPASTPALSVQGKVAQTACMSACKHLSTSLMQMLLDTELKQISMGAIQQFNLDVIQCERKLIRLYFGNVLHAVFVVFNASPETRHCMKCDMMLYGVCLCALVFPQCLLVQSRSLGFKETLYSWPLLIYDR